MKTQTGADERYRKLINAIDQGYCVIEMIFDEQTHPVDYRFLEVNHVFEEQTGLHDATGRRMKEMVPNHDDHWFRIYGEVAASGQPKRFMEKSESLNRWFDVYAFAEGEPGGNRVALLFRDITSEKMAEEKVRESERSLRNTILQAPLGMCILRGPKLIIEIANEKMFEFWGKPNRVMIGRPMFEALPEAGQQGYEDMLQRVLQTGVSFSAKELTVTLPRGETIDTVFINFAFEPLREPGGAVSGIMVVVTDVTDQVLARQKLEMSEAALHQRVEERTLQLQRSNADLQQFAHVASHDLKEPLRKIRLYTNRLSNEFTNSLPPAVISYLDKIDRASARMASMIDGVLKYSSVDAQRGQDTAIDLQEIVDQVVEDLELLIAEKKATINCSNLPVINASVVLFHQLFYNLLNNALKFAHPDRPLVVDITSPAQDRSVIIEIRDNGIGFDPLYSADIFKTFVRLHPKDSFEGTGLGLALCQKIVERYEGKISADGRPGKGAVFTITLPSAILASNKEIQ